LLAFISITLPHGAQQMAKHGFQLRMITGHNQKAAHHNADALNPPPQRVLTESGLKTMNDEAL